MQYYVCCAWVVHVAQYEPGIVGQGAGEILVLQVKL